MEATPRQAEPAGPDPASISNLRLGHYLPLARLAAGFAPPWLGRRLQGANRTRPEGRARSVAG